MFTMSFYLLHCMLNFVLKSAHKFIYCRNNIRKNPDFPDYEVARCPSFEANCRLTDDENITFAPAVYIQRYLVACDIIRNQVAHSSKLLKVVDFGCAEVSLFEYLKRIDGLSKVLCIDVDEELLERYHPRAKPLGYNYICPRETPFSVDILAGSIADCDPRLLGTDIIIAIELIEHLYPQELNAVPWTVFGYIQPKVAVFTTPNVEFNVMFKSLKGFRHDDHKFEWTRREFHDWAENIVLRYPNYQVRFSGIGPGPVETEHLGCVSQMAVFIRKGAAIEEPVSPEDETSKYKLIKSYDYPFSVDERTDAEKTRDEVAHHRIKFGYMEPYCDQDIIKIELTKFLPHIEKWCKSVEELKTILESFGSVIEHNENGDLCVVGMEDERQSDEEEGYLTGDLETENPYSDWGTYRASGDRTISPAWDVTQVVQDDWDSWGLNSEPSTPPNGSNASEETEENADAALPMCEADNKASTDEEETKACFTLTENACTEVIAQNTDEALPVGAGGSEVGKDEKEARICTTVVENICSEDTSKSIDTSGKEQLAKSTHKKTRAPTKVIDLEKEELVKSTRQTARPPVEVIDLTENEEIMITSDLTTSNETVFPVSSESCEDSSTAEGVWVISEELRYGKPKRRNYSRYKYRKSFDSDKCEERETGRNRLSPKHPRNKNGRGGRRNVPETVGRNSDIIDANKPSESTSHSVNEPPKNQETLPLIMVNNAPYEHNLNSVPRKSKSSNSKFNKEVSNRANVCNNVKISATNVTSGGKNIAPGANNETVDTSPLTASNGNNPPVAVSDSGQNRGPKPKPARRNRRKKQTPVSSATGNTSSASYSALDSTSSETLNNSNIKPGSSNVSKNKSQADFNRSKRVTYLNKLAGGNSNSSSQTSQTSEITENNTRNLLPKRLNHDKIDNIVGEKSGNEKAC